MAKSIVIIGGGIAGVSAAEEIRAKNATYEISIIERENVPLYSRVLLPHYIKGVVPREKVFLKSESWYQEKNITYFSGTEAECVDVENKFVRISDGRELPFDEVIFATGTTPRLLNEHARGVHYLYTLADADGIREHLGRIKSQERALVYGGGFIACEFINALDKAGIKQELLIRGEGFWSKILQREGQEYLRNILRKKNVPFHENVGEIELITVGENLSGAKDAKGREYEGVFLGVGIGADLETLLAKDAGIKVAQGIIGDAMQKTSQQHAYVAGDVAETKDTKSERYTVLGNWAHAQQEGRRVGKIICEEEAQDIPLSQYTTELLGCKMAFLGDVQKNAADEVEVIATESGYIQIFLRKDILVGAVLLEDMSQRMKYAGMIGKKWK